jgi:GNAT superfamily N-acetyltransferase
MPYEIIKYTAEYKNGVIDLIGQTLADIGVVDPLKLPIDDEDLSHIDEIYSGKGGFWLTLEDGKLIGTVAIRDLGEGVAKLNRMFVLVDHHGAGVGQVLFDHALNFARSQGFTKIVLNTHENMNRAHHFYEKNGFTKLGKAGNKYQYERVI